jgi:4-amino-4-deoxy-L-arabinose transferase-like glycosyltransferase
VLGQKIAHIPSTHHQDEFNKFRLASDRTKKLYTDAFGEQPAEIWSYATIHEPLNMEKSNTYLDKVIGVGIIMLLPAIIIAYLLLKPLYIAIHNPYFVVGYVTIVIVALLGLWFYNNAKINAIVKGWQNDVFAFNLTALELVYLQKSNIDFVVHGVVNQLIKTDVVAITDDKILVVDNEELVADAVSFCVVQAIKANPDMPYLKLINVLKLKPAFNKTARAMDAFEKYVSGSKQFIRLFILNFVISAVVLIMGIVRIATGVVREKPVTIIAGVVIFALLLIVFNLYRLVKAIGTSALPGFYSKNIIYEAREYHNWDWQYFLLGSTVFVPVFIPLTADSYNGSSGSDSGSSCGSGCGGSSCGGCGGD